MMHGQKNIKSCEYGHELSFFIEGSTLFVHLGEYMFLRNGCVVLCVSRTEFEVLM